MPLRIDSESILFVIIFYVVGGGTAGCVLANRLSVNPAVTVLLLEAGGEEIDYTMIDIPFAATDLLGTNVDWNYITVPQNHSCLGSIDQVNSLCRYTVNSVQFILFYGNRGTCIIKNI